MHTQNHTHDPQGPTTGPIYPVQVVIESTDEEDPLPEYEQDHHDDDLDHLPPVSDTHGEQDLEAEPMPPLPPRDPQPLPLPVSRPRRTRPRVPLIAGGIGLLLLGMIAGMFLTQHPELPGWALGQLPGVLAPTATITLTPASARLSLTVPITAVTGTPDASKQQVSARLLSTKSTTFTQAVKTTGHGHTDAHQAQGTLTFYNAAPYAQTIAAGTVLTSGENVQIVTDAAAVLPAGNPPAFGVATVAAHAVSVGPQGNLAPLSLDGLCCVAGISVKNTGIFTGGQNARDYSIVTRQDVDSIAGPQRALLSQQAQAGLQE